jgi:hypothetical protein
MGWVPTSEATREELEALAAQPVPRLHLRHAALCATRAPSPWNTQPWLLRIGERSLEVWADRSRALNVGDPHQRELAIACGAAAQHAAVALARLGWRFEVDFMPEFRAPDCLVRITLTARAEPGIEARELYSALLRRHTQRGAFPHELLCEHVGMALDVAALREGVLPAQLGGAAREQVAEWVEAAVIEQGHDAALRRERLEWLERSASNGKEGIAARELGLSCVPRALMPVLLGSSWGNRRHARREAQWLREAPCMLLLSTLHEEPEEWLRAGFALGRVLLVATAAGLTAAFHNAAIEVPQFRHALRRLSGEQAFPQLLLRLGYGLPGEQSGRRSVPEVCFDESALECRRGGPPCPLVP